MTHYLIASTFIFISIIATYYITKWEYQKEITRLNKRNSKNHILFKSKTDTLCMALEEKTNQLILLKDKTKKLTESVKIANAVLCKFNENLKTKVEG